MEEREIKSIYQSKVTTYATDSEPSGSENRFFLHDIDEKKFAILYHSTDGITDVACTIDKEEVTLDGKDKRYGRIVRFSIGKMLDRIVEKLVDEKDLSDESRPSLISRLPDYMLEAFEAVFDDYKTGTGVDLSLRKLVLLRLKEKQAEDFELCNTNEERQAMFDQTKAFVDQFNENYDARMHDYEASKRQRDEITAKYNGLFEVE